MRITLGPRADIAVGALHEVEWGELTEWLKQHPRTQAAPGASKDGPWIAFAEFEGNYRHLRSHPRGCAVPIDLDYSGLSADAIAATLHGFRFCAYTTFQHTAAAPRWRIIIPVDGTLDAATHRATWNALSALFGNTADVSAKDITRLNYLPGLCVAPADAAVITGEGALFPVVSAPPSSTAQVEENCDGPVEGWGGPIDDTELLRRAFAARTRPTERFGQKTLLQALWEPDADALSTRYPSREPMQAWDHTAADMALANELSYYTGRDRPRVLRLMLQAGCVTLRGEPEEEMARKLSYAITRAVGREEVFKWPPVVVPSPPADVSRETHAVPTPPVGAIPAPPPLLHPEDFYSFLKEHKYIYRPTRELWVAASLPAELRTLVDIDRPVHRLTWAPGQPERFQTHTWDAADEIGAQTFYYNLYRPPRVHTTQGNPAPWLTLLHRLYPDHAVHLLHWMADRVQNPGKKINHAVVLGSGTHGIGKDSLLAPLQYAVGEANYATITPARIIGRFNGFRQSVVLQISESRNMGEESGARIDKFQLYEAMKDLCAAPPARLEVDTKNVKEYWISNVTGPVLTTNHRLDGLYIPPEDRRFYCAWSNAPKLAKEDAAALWDWYARDGLDIVANFLSHADLMGWDRAAPPPLTEWWHELVNFSAPQDGSEGLEDTLEKLGRPDRVTWPEVLKAVDPDTAVWLRSPANRRKIDHRMLEAGYVKHRNPGEKRGRWKMDGIYVVIYRRSN